MAAVAAAAAATFHDESELVKSFCAKLTPQSEPDSESETMMWGCEIARVVCTVKKNRKEKGIKKTVTKCFERQPEEAAVVWVQCVCPEAWPVPSL